jgi:UDP-N-acetylmuramate--alanine ligase
MNDEIKKIRSVYFIGIGGIGMSAVARFFNSKGIRVSGYDRAATTLTEELEAEGVAVHYEENVELIPKNADLVVYTPAVPKDHRELVFYQQNGYRTVKRSDVLQMITESSFNICVAGTHGKTTTTTMIAHLLRHSGYGCNAFLGGIAVNYGTNFWPQAADASSNRDVSVVEADEYDRSFLKLNPDVAVITAMDPDHLDIYGTAEAMEQAFIDFSHKLRPGGLLINKFGLKRTTDLRAERILSYSLQNESADAYAKDIVTKDGSYEFNVVIKDKNLENVLLHMGGMHNVENAVAAITVASSLTIENNQIKAGMESFRGVKRRFEYIVKNNRVVFIDDYAHHPEELRALIQGAKTLFRQKKCTIIFQPHLYTRTRDMANGFAEVLDLADEIILLPIYPAREEPIEGVSSEMILRKMKNENRRLLQKEELMSWLERDYSKSINTEFGEVLITAGAGDIDMMVEPIRAIIERI